MKPDTAPNVTKGRLSVERFVSATVSPDAEPIELSGRGGRTAVVNSIAANWRHDDEEGWATPGSFRVTQQDRLKSGGLGEPYARTYYSFNSRVFDQVRGMAELVEACRPAPIKIVAG